MRTTRWMLAATMAAFGVACTRAEQTGKREVSTGEVALPTATLTAADVGLFATVPAVAVTPANPVTDAKVSLGRMLYYENTLSDGHDVSCNTCHPLNAWGADGRRVSLGHEGRAGTRNAPTVYNAAGQMAQFWDGRAASVEEQAKGPILNPAEMAMPDSAAVLAHLRGSAAYRAAFTAAFPGEAAPVNYNNVGKAIGAFERRLMTPSRWDRFLSGDSSALSPEEQGGFKTFLASGCQACHNGSLVGGAMYQKLGLVKPWPALADSGRYRVTKQASDLFVFKVPTLRNIERTGPYFHDGSVADLGSAIRMMATYQTGKELSPTEVSSIQAWLKTLTGEIPTDYIALPQRPAK